MFLHPMVIRGRLVSVHDPRPGAVSERREDRKVFAAAYKADHRESAVAEVEGESLKLKAIVSKIKPVRWWAITLVTWLELADTRAPNNAGV